MNRPLLIGGLGLTALLLGLLGSGFGRDTHKLQSPLVGRQAPPFTLARVDGQGTVSLESLRGRPAVVNFWATWCQPCLTEHHVLQAGARHASGVQFVGIVYDDEPGRIAEVLQERGGSAYPTVIDKGGRAAIAYGVAGVPETFFIDARGQIVSKFEGPLTVQQLAEFLAPLTAGGT
jgi:cytochrome c biogenesis protein CcmG/thiol:disulfide interchange protein DsbE